MITRIVFILALLALMLTLLVPAVTAADGNSPAQLVDQGWTCYPREGTYVYCMVPFWKAPNLLPAVVINKVFLTQDVGSTDAPFVGTTTYLRADLYAGQPCPSSDRAEWVSIAFGGGLYPYYYCRHLVQ